MSTSMSSDQNDGSGRPPQPPQPPQPQHGYPEPAQPYAAGQPYPPQDALDPSTTPLAPAYAQPAASYGEPRPQPVNPPGPRRAPSAFPQDAARFARQHLRTPETKEFFKTSEFFLTVFGAFVLVLAAAIQQNFDAPEMWRLFTFLFMAYVISRGIAKAGSNRSEPDNRS